MKPRRRGFFPDDIDDEFERIREEMERMIESALRFSFESDTEITKPLVYGFSMRIGSDGKPIVQEFGNIKPKVKGLSEEREPLVDVIEEKDMITVIAEIPGVNKDDIKLKATEKTLLIKVDTPERKYLKEIKFPKRIKPKTAEAKYKNGVLEVKFKKFEEEKKEEGEEIKIE